MHKEFSVIYINILKNSKLKRVSIGTRVYVPSDDKEKIVKDYDERTKKYDLEDNEGFFNKHYRRKDFELIK